MHLSARSCLLAAALACIGPTVASCGGEESEESRVVAAIEAMQDDMSAGRLTSVCAAMSDRPQRQIGSIGHGRAPTTCQRDVRELVLQSENAASADQEGLRGTVRPRVVDVDLDPRGDRAVATMTLGTGPFRVRLTKEGDTWKLDDFFGASAPPPKGLR